jgi:hypothetical protein
MKEAIITVPTPPSFLGVDRPSANMSVLGSVGLLLSQPSRGAPRSTWATPVSSALLALMRSRVAAGTRSVGQHQLDYFFAAPHGYPRDATRYSSFAALLMAERPSFRTLA